MARTMLALSLLVGAGCSSAPAPRTAPTTSTLPDPTTTTTETTTTTTEPEPTTTTTSTTVYDWGDVICPSEPHPAHHEPCQGTRARSAPTEPYEPPSPQSQTVRQDSGSAPLACIRSYEQGQDGYATDTGNGFGGAYQFDQPTWESVGGTGWPADASPAEQDRRATMLYESRGLAPWPTPEQMC